MSRRGLQREKSRKHVLNKLIDSFFHPLFRKDPSFIFMDFLAHSIVEGKVDLDKFLKYNWKHLEKWIKKKR